MGYTLDYKDYICYDSTSNKTFISRHVSFDEETYPFSSQSSVSSTSSSPTLPSSFLPSILGPPPFIPISHPPSSSIFVSPPLHDSPPSIPLSSSIPSSSQAPIPTPQNTHPMQTRAKSGITKRKIGFHITTDSITEPTSFTSAFTSSVWQASMKEEFDSLQKQGT